MVVLQYDGIHQFSLSSICTLWVIYIKETIEHEKNVGEFYDAWQPHLDACKLSSKTQAIHYGYYEKGIKSYQEAVLNMNNFVGKLLDLDKDSSKKILDAGCGVGATSIYLAKKYPNIKFTGITVAPGQVELAKKHSKEGKISNTDFILDSFVDSNFPDEHFDGIFALESSAYAENHDKFVDEMYRILKKGGKLVVIDGFRTSKSLNFLTKKFYKYLCEGYGGTQYPDINRYKEYLEFKGFEKIYVKNITKYVSRGFFLIFLIMILKGMPNVFINLIKSRHCLEEIHETPKVLGKIIPASIIGMSGTVGYFATSATKKI